MAQPEEKLRKLLEQIAKNENYELYNIDIEPINTGGANYSSVLFKAKIIAPNRDELKLFAKVANMAESMRNTMDMDSLFGMERYFYTDLAKKYEYLQDKFEIPKDERLIIPKFYGHNSNYMEETIVMEDLGAQGYGLHDRFKVVGWDYAAKAVEGIAKLHALSFGFQHEFPEEHGAKLTEFQISLNDFLNEIKKTSNIMAQTAYTVVDDNMRKQLDNFLASLNDNDGFKKYYEPGKWSLITHSDYRPSNLMHKNEDGNMIVVPIDYQTLRIGRPASDLLYFIYTATDKQFRTQHLENLLDHYYSTLAKFLNYFQLDPEKVFSRKEFDEDFKDMLPFGLCMSIFLLPIVMVETNDVPDMSVEGVTFNSFSVKSNDAYKERFNECLQEFIEWGIL